MKTTTALASSAAAAAILFCSQLAAAETAEVRATTGVSFAADESGGSVRSKSQSWMVAPHGTYVIGSKLRLLKSDETPFGDAAKATDLALFDLTARGSFGDRLELGIGLSVLTKEMTGMSEPTFQGGSGTLRVGLSKWAAIDFATSARPLLAELGWMVNPSASLAMRANVDRHLRFAGGAGVSWTNLFLDDADRNSFAELGVAGQIIFPVQNHFAAWAGADYHVPITDPAGSMNLDPQPRLGVHGGFAFTFVPEWNLYAEYSIIDRGSLDDPATTIPVIDGGFDQTQIIVGVSRRFHDTDRDRLRD
ncbi:MAG: hypothetical protein KJO07_11730 [Deltaproteobacteria bacterium]|jgi:hypothetical protein|nr:hypothetical protein [Deltaproteobacteria bacterium]